MIVLAVDQSSQVSGYSVWENGNLLEVGKVAFDGEFIDRIAGLRDWLLEKIDEYEEDKVEVVLEEIQQQTNIETFKKLAMLQGCLLLALRDTDIKTHLVYASQWKARFKILGKNRSEQKRNAQKYVLETYGKKVTQDEADAICIGEYIAKGTKNWGS